jgi:hypothetical protein
MLGHPETGICQVCQAARMVGVEMRQHDLAHVPSADSQPAQLSPDFLVRVN